jgi:hypothetical protein
MMAGTLDRAAPWIGLFAGPIAWLISTNLNYTFAAAACGWATMATALPVAVVLAGISVVGFALALWSWRRAPRGEPVDAPESQLPRKFLAGAGIISGLLFAAVILLQGAATLFIAGCAR